MSDVVAQGRSVVLEFSFGKLLVKERIVRFAFAAELYIAHGLEVPEGAADDIDYKPIATFSSADNSVMQGLSLRGTGMREQLATGCSSKSKRAGTHEHCINE